MLLVNQSHKNHKNKSIKRSIILITIQEEIMIIIITIMRIDKLEVEEEKIIIIKVITINIIIRRIIKKEGQIIIITMNIKKDKTTAINIKKIKNKITVIIDDVAYNCIF